LLGIVALLLADSFDVLTLPVGLDGVPAIVLFTPELVLLELFLLGEPLD
jgi:hypothetical protein